MFSEVASFPLRTRRPLEVIPRPRPEELQRRRSLRRRSPGRVLRIVPASGAKDGGQTGDADRFCPATLSRLFPPGICVFDLRRDWRSSFLTSLRGMSLSFLPAFSPFSWFHPSFR